MKAIAIVGASALGKTPFVEPLVEALRFDWSVSIVKHAPDGFDMDTPGKASYTRREAGAREVMLVGDRRLVLLSEYGRDPEPPLEALLRRMAPVDLVIVEGFREPALPTIEVHLPSNGQLPRWPSNRHVVAVVSDEAVGTALPCFALDEIGALADFVAARAGLVEARNAPGAPRRIAAMRE